VNGQESETVAITGCKACRAGIPQSDRFCRLCGASQTDPLVPATETLPEGLPSSGSLACWRPPSDYVTRVMPRGAFCESLSGPLVKAVADGLSANLSLRFLDRRVKRIVLILVSVPIWLMIVLLSPLETYATVKGISDQR